MMKNVPCHIVRAYAVGFGKSSHILQSRTNFISTQYYLDNRSLTIVDHCKYLGVVLQLNLNWAKHIEEKVTKVNTTLAMIRRNLKNVSKPKDLCSILNSC